MLVYTGSQCLEHISGSACILCLTMISYEKNLLFLKGFTCELMLVGHTVMCNFNSVSYKQTHETDGHSPCNE